MKRLMMVMMMVGAPLVTMAQDVAEQTTPPPAAAPRPLNLPKPAERTLANGLRVIAVQKSGAPIAAARLIVRAGGESDPTDRAGLADLTASLLTKGTKTKSAKQIAEGVEALGASLNSSAGWDQSVIDVDVMTSKLAPALAFVADVVRNPAFSKEELERLRAQNVDALAVALRQPRALSGFVATRVIFAAQPYGHNLGGTPESLARITRDDITAFHRSHYRPDNAILVVAGDITPAAVFAMAEKELGGWTNGGGARATVTLQTPGAGASPNAAAATDGPRVLVVDMPEAGQASVLVARQGLRRADPMYSVSQVTNSILGGGYSSRLNQEIRIKRGLSYGANSSFDLRQQIGPFTAGAQTKNESAAEVAGIIVDELGRLAAGAVPDTELGPRKAVLVGNFGRSLETSSALVQRIGALALYGLPFDELTRYTSGIEGISAADVQSFSTAHLAATGATVVIVGDAKKFLDPLRARFKNVDVIPIAQLDLNSPTLRR